MKTHTAWIQAQLIPDNPSRVIDDLQAHGQGKKNACYKPLRFVELLVMEHYRSSS